MKRTLTHDVSHSQAARATILARRRKMSFAALTLPAQWRRVAFVGSGGAGPAVAAADGARANVSATGRSADAVSPGGCEVLHKSPARPPLSWLA